jgi:SAM-dependent methyltransferase
MAISPERRALHEENRASWNEATRAHNSHKRDQAAFLRAGNTTLFPEEVALLGDVRGKRVVHLQCNAGQDTLSIAAMGATVLGVDISDEAVGFARQLALDSGIAAAFVRSDVYDWLEDSANEGRFDVAFCSYGALCWLSDLPLWAKGVARVLAPGGRFVCIDFHPMLYVFEWDWTLRYDYFGGEPARFEGGVGDYVAMSGALLTPMGYQPGLVDFKNPNPVNEFQHASGELIGSLLRAELVLESFEEYPYANGWIGRERMREVEGRRAVPPEDLPALPLMFSATARKA